MSENNDLPEGAGETEALKPKENFERRPHPRINPAATVQKLLAIRRKHGAESPAGHHASNLDEIYQNKAKATDREVFKNLTKSEARQWVGLGRALRRGTRT